MRDLVTRTKIIFIVILIISQLIIVGGIYIPMRDEIRANSLEEFVYIASAKADVISERIDKSIQGAKSLSSRTMIKNKIIEYKNGYISFEELSLYTEDKYLEGVSVFDNLIFADRIVDGRIVVSIDSIDINHSYDINKIIESGRFSNISVENEDYFLEVLSPIVFDQEIIGYDYLKFKLNDVINNINEIEINVEVMKKDYLTGIVNHDMLEENGNKVYYSESLDEDTSVLLSIDKNTLFKRMYTITNKVIFYVIFGYLILAILVYFFVIKFAENKISLISTDRDLYKDYAYIDNLTGAFSRIFIDEYVKNNADGRCLIIVIDLDDFKQINDTYGHLFGDEILVDFVKTIKSILRYEDAVVRFGGDEFLLILDSDDYEKGEIVIKRLREELSKNQNSKQVVHFSYGIEYVEDVRNLMNAIEKADAKMFANKESKNDNKIR